MKIWRNTKKIGDMMTIDKVLVLIFSALGMGFTYWFFLMKKEKVTEVLKDEVEIEVKGGYSPGVISVPSGKPTRLNFTRRDESSCLEEVVIPEFKIRKFLPMNKTVSIEIKPSEKGEFKFECGMNMFHGKIIVK